MDIFSDSDTENSLPLLSVADVDTLRLRNVYAFFSEETRERLRAGAQNTPFAALYEDIDTQIGAGETPLDHDLFQNTTADAPLRQEDPTEPLAADSGPVHSVLSQSQNAQAAPQISPEIPPQTLEDTATRRPRSLRKRTFASRHPYIADQADWLGICTVDSINEMFDGDEEISRVVRVLNQLYLQKKKRYPDEDRYRSKDFYTHLGHSKLLAIQGDTEVAKSDKIDKIGDNADSQEQNYDPEIQSSQVNHSAEEDELIPYDEFDIPYTQDDNEGPRVTESEPPKSAYSAAESSSSDAEEESAEEEQYIRVGGRYRKLSTILRGVLPESAKRLGVFDRKSPVKKRRKTVRDFTPRRGLAMKKHKASGSTSADLERELYLEQDSDSTEDSVRQSLVQPLITERPLSRYERKDSIVSFASLSRNPTSLYASDTPEPQYVDSGSDSEIEAFSVRKPSTFLDHGGSTLSFQDQPFDTGEVQEHDEIDHLFATREKARQSGHTSKRANKAPGRANAARAPYKRQKQSRINLPKISIGRPAATKPRPKKSGANQKRHRVLDRIQTRLPGFRQTLSQGRTASGARDDTKSATKSTTKAEEKRKKQTEGGPGRAPFQQPYKRNPIISTSAIEVESTRNSTSAHPVVYDSVISDFRPTRQSLLGSHNTDSNSLTGLSDISGVTALRDGRIFFPNEDSVTIVFLGKSFHLAQYNMGESQKHVITLLSSMKRLLASPKLLPKPEVKADSHSAVRGLIKWFLMCRERPSLNLWEHVRAVLDEFSKLQTREVRAIQITIHSQFLYLFWVLVQLELSYKSQQDTMMRTLGSYCSDFFMNFFRSFSAQDFSAAYAKESSSHDLFQCVMLIFTIFEKEEKRWWPVMVEAIDEMVIFGNEITAVLDLTYLLCAVIPRKDFSWRPFLAILGKLKTAVDSAGHRRFIDTCELANQRLEWPLEEKILTQLYAFFGTRKFSNFTDESSVPSSIGVIQSRADIPHGSVFERFLGLLYMYVSDLSSAKEVKRLISKLLASSQYHYVRGRKSQITFANRLNLIVLLSQISDVDLGSQLTNLILQVRDSADPFVYGRSLDALQVFCDTSKNRLPSKAFEMLFLSLADRPSLFQKLIDLMGHTFRGHSPTDEKGVFGFLRILSTSDLCRIPDSSILELLGTVFLSIMEVELYDNELSESQMSITVAFQRSLLKLLSSRMDRLPTPKGEEDQAIEETVELAIQIWMLSSKISRSQHWNNMMYQRYSYLGNSISRNRFVMFFCLEFIQYGVADPSVLQEIEKVFLTGLVSPTVSKYAVELYQKLSHNPSSIFWVKDSSIPEISSVVSLQAFRLRIISRTIENIVISSTLHSNEQLTIISGFVKRLHDVYTDHRSEQGVTDMCKRVTGTLQRTAKAYVANLNEFWELSTKLGFPNRNMQIKWANSDNQGKVRLLNVEFISALAYGKDHAIAMDNWKTEKSDLVLFALVQVYASAIPTSSAYWAHICILLEYTLSKLEKFQILTNEQSFKSFLSLLKELALMSNPGNDTRYVLHEIRALKASTAILQHAYYVFDGYKDKQDIRHNIYEFVANVDIACPKRYKLSTSFMDVTIDQIQSGHVSFHPKHQHTPEQYLKASSDLKEVLENLTSIASDRAKEEMKAKGLDDFVFF